MPERPNGQRTYSAREIVEEFFPATPERLVPGGLGSGRLAPGGLAPGRKRLRLQRSGSGNLEVLDAAGRELLVMEPVAQAGDPSQRLCCDLCLHSAGRPDLALHRAQVPGSHGRRWRYVTACRDELACEARRHDDAVLVRLLAD